MVTIEPRSYREVIGEAIQDLRPHHDVVIVESGALEMEVSRLDPELVVASQPNTVEPTGRPAWVEFRPYDQRTAICLDGEYSENASPELAELLSVVDETERLSQVKVELGGC